MSYSSTPGDYAVEALAKQNPKVYAAAVAVWTSATASTVASAVTSPPTPVHSAVPISSSVVPIDPSNAPSLLTSLPPPPVPPVLPPWISANKPAPSAPAVKRRRVHLQHSSTTHGAPSASQILGAGQSPPRMNSDGGPMSPQFESNSIPSRNMNGVPIYSPPVSLNGGDGEARRPSAQGSPNSISNNSRKIGKRPPLRHRIPFLARNLASGIRQLPQARSDALGFGQGRRKSTAAAGTLENWRNQCPYCTAKYPSQWKVDNHVRRNHFDSTFLFHCDEPGCTYGFATILSFRSHKARRHGQNRPFDTPEIP